MIRRLIRKHWILGCAVMVLLGCKTTPPAAEAPPFVPYELLDAGEEPRTLLRYAIADGTTTTSTISIKAIPGEKGAPTMSVSGLQSLKFKAVLGPAKVVGDEIRYTYEVVDSSAVAGPAASKKLHENIEAHADFLTGIGASSAINNRGNLLGTQYNEKAKDVPLRLLWTLSNVESFLSIVALPKEEVGVGARWQIRGMLALYGIRMEQQATYTLVERTGDEIVLDMEFERVGERQVLEFAEDKSTVEVESSEQAATGRIRLDLKTLGSNGTASGTVKDRVVVVEGGIRERREIDESFEIRIKSTTTVGAPATEG